MEFVPSNGLPFLEWGIQGHLSCIALFLKLQGIILGGSDTTAVTSIWILSLLLSHRDVMKRAQEEIDLKVGRDRSMGGKIGYGEPSFHQGHCQGNPKAVHNWSPVSTTRGNGGL